MKKSYHKASSGETRLAVRRYRRHWTVHPEMIQSQVAIYHGQATALLIQERAMKKTYQKLVLVRLLSAVIASASPIPCM